MPNSYVLKKKNNIKSDQKRAKFFVMEFVRVCYKFIHAAKKYSLDYSILVFIVQIGILLFFCCDSLQKSALKKSRHYTIKKNAPVNVSCHLLHLSLNK